jgi:hypothetical protein
MPQQGQHTMPPQGPPMMPQHGQPMLPQPGQPMMPPGQPMAQPPGAYPGAPAYPQPGQGAPMPVSGNFPAHTGYPPPGQPSMPPQPPMPAQPSMPPQPGPAHGVPPQGVPAGDVAIPREITGIFEVQGDGAGAPPPPQPPAGPPATTTPQAPGLPSFADPALTGVDPFAPRGGDAAAPQPFSEQSLPPLGAPPPPQPGAAPDPVSQPGARGLLEDNADLFPATPDPDAELEDALGAAFGEPPGGAPMAPRPDFKNADDGFDPFALSAPDPLASSGPMPQADVPMPSSSSPAPDVRKTKSTVVFRTPEEVAALEAKAKAAEAKAGNKRKDRLDSPEAKEPARFISGLSWGAFGLALVVFFCGVTFAGWSSGAVDLDPVLMATFERRMGVRPPWSYAGLDERLVSDLEAEAKAARERSDFANEAVAWRRVLTKAPEHETARLRMKKLMKLLGDSRDVADLLPSQ